MTMQNAQPKPEPTPEPMSEQDAETLLPWYANGRTSHAEARAIEAALKTSSGLRAQLDAVRRERIATIEATDEAGQPSPENLQRLLKQLGTTRQFPPIRAARPSLLERLFGELLAPRQVLQFALAAACLVIAVEGIALYRVAGTGKPSYITASAPTETATGPRLIITFQPQATAGAIQDLLSKIDASIVKGPTPDGGYIVALPESADADALSQQLRSHADLIASVAKGS
jgi:anti-sigma-K factor RskA